jgi:pantothenate kinase
MSLGDTKAGRPAFAGTGSFPSFDHKVGDPVDDDIEVELEHRVVLIEGNYVLLGGCALWASLPQLCPAKSSQHWLHLAPCPADSHAAGNTDDEPWRDIRDIVDETWYVDCDVPTAMQRVLARQVANGAAPEEARKRVETNDRPNALQIVSSRHRAQLVLPQLPLAR